MITLTVLSLNGVPSGSALSAQFDELGGTIGRADTNQLVLPDPDRAISRVHAQVVYRNGGFSIVDRGSNPILVNGEPVGSGRQVAIRGGDQVQIGGFLLEVRQVAAAAAPPNAIDDPFADLLGPAGRAPSPPGAKGGSPLFDPLAGLGGAGGSAGASQQPPAKAASPGGIPDDWDPFAPDPVAARPEARDFAQSLGRPRGAGNLGLDGGAAAPAALIPDLPAGGGGGNDDSLDALFGLKPGSGGDPLAHSVLDAPMSAPNMAASQDPLRSLSSAPRASGQTARDDSSDLHRPYQPPPAGDRAPTPPPVASIPPSPPPAAPAGAVLSWDTPEGDGRTVIRPATRPTAPPSAAVRPVSADPLAGFATGPADGADPLAAFIRAPAVAAPPPAAPAQARPTAPAIAVAPSLPPASTPPHGAADEAALLAALLDGLAVPGLRIEALTPDLMRLVGQLLHESARGTVDLLVARAALKREVRAVGTIIVAQKNNPLKFSPSAEVALQHLLSPPMRGFMAPAPAMRDAYDDLRAHQFGFIAGMRAALAGVIDRFRPEELEGRLAQRSGLRALLPGSRKAAMWDLFTEHYAQISTEAEEDFHSLFGEAFLEAYEQHIAQQQDDAE